MRRAEALDTVRQQAALHSDAFYVVDLKEIARKYAQWRTEIPRARPYYAVKCNDDPRIVATLAKLGAGFDCASKGEMSMVTGVGVAPQDIVFAHPAKQISHIAYAKSKGIKRMTFDNEDELRKIMREYRGAEVILRILTDDSASVCRLGLKFGCPLTDVPRVMALAKKLGAKVAGISYHVGSGNGDANSFGTAVRDARAAIDFARAAGHNPTVLDLGGGYPGSEMGAEIAGLDRRLADTKHAVGPLGVDPYAKHPSFSTIAAVIRRALDEHFPEGCGIELIAEPGRFFCRSSHVLAVHIIGKRETVDRATGGKRLNYYINEGLYGSFNCILYDHSVCNPSMLLTTRDTHGGHGAAATHTGKPQSDSPGVFSALSLGSDPIPSWPTSATSPVRADWPAGTPRWPTTIFGNTCDSIDLLTETAVMPEMYIGDVLAFENMGAYTVAGSRRFNGFPISRKVYMGIDGSIDAQATDA